MRDPASIRTCKKYRNFSDYFVAYMLVWFWYQHCSGITAVVIMIVALPAALFQPLLCPFIVNRDPACIWDPASNRDPASISTLYFDPRPVSGTRPVCGTRLLSEDLR